ncbi:aminotransferase class V-fold PLP-dependent enzyme [Pseudomonas aeruginosa]|nr:aminotransferase class V-fold PLP-dependent enzyme [Pseudomonas aeruginosa]
MHVNNEIGTVNDIAAIGELPAPAACCSVDAAQSTGKVEIDLDKLGRPDVLLRAQDLRPERHWRALRPAQAARPHRGQMHGGGHERGMRSGTLATHQIVGMGEAFRIAKEEMAQENARVLALRDRFFAQIDGLEELYINGSMTSASRTTSTSASTTSRASR